MIDLKLENLAPFLTERLGHEVVVRYHRPIDDGGINRVRRVILSENGVRHDLVLKADPAVPLGLGLDRAGEAAALRAARDAGVPAPPVWFACADPGLIGAPFLLLRRVEGKARPSAIVALDDARGEILAHDLGAALAELHRSDPGRTPAGTALDRINACRAWLDGLDAAEPTLEWALARLAARPPALRAPGPLHGDPRTGNLVVKPDGRLAALLDWEFANVGDPAEDLGWLIGRYWRFGRLDRPVGGFAGLPALKAGYERGGGDWPAPFDLAWWQAYGAVRWAVIALMQGRRARLDLTPSLDLALTAFGVPVLERDVIALIENLHVRGAPL